MMTTYINVNKHTIAANAKHGTNEPVIRVARTKSAKAEYHHNVGICDKDGNIVARIIYSPHCAIMKCGARLIIEADHQVIPI
jgi:hypothetical protein